jgi:uncharacterized membrane protein YhaH (DUF805 family)
MNWYLEALKKYAKFTGRSRRKEYWLFVLFTLIIAFVLGIIDGAAGLASNIGWGPLGGLYTLAVLIPSIAVSVRRLHDTNRSGWWLLIALVPLIGAIVLLIFMVQASQQGENRYGTSPKASGIAAKPGVAPSCNP